MEKYKILFVCLGNICRSPAAEGIMKHLVKENGQSERFEIDSAGTSGYHTNELPDSRMRQHGSHRGYDFDSLSRKFTEQDFEDFDLIVTMDDSNYNNVKRLAPSLDSMAKVHRMVEYAQKHKHDHIPDPYYSGSEGFELVLDLLEDACKDLYHKIINNNEI